ncbi:MAG: hypothetical protein ACNA78_04695 [Balneolaceae bacterium]
MGSLPTQPLFYIIAAILYFQLPFFEVIIYRITWAFNAVKSIPVFLLKSIYNKDVVGYSGEVYFFLWAQKNVPYEKMDIARVIKDNNIISSVASTLVAFGLVSVFFFTGQIRLLNDLFDGSANAIWGGVFLVVLIVFLVVAFRKKMIFMPLRSAYKIFVIHMLRLIAVLFLIVYMYYIVIPETPLYVWFTLLSVEIILSRIPLLPNRDLIYVGLSIGMAEGLMVSESAIAGLMVARTVINKVLNVSLFAFSAALKEKTDVEIPDDSLPDEDSESADQTILR